MIRLYYVETKSYWQDELGTDYQIADGGDMPIIYTSKKKAIERAKRMEQRNIEIYGYVTTISDSKYPCKKTNCLYAVRQEHKDRRLRHEIRVYETYTC